MNKTKAYVGIDLAISKSKILPICICTKINNQLRPFFLNSKKYPKPPKGIGNYASLFQENIQVFTDKALTYIREISTIENLEIQCIAIDAPKSFKKTGTERRDSEKAMDSQGISCFTTPSFKEFEKIIQKGIKHIKDGGEQSTLPHANQIWMLVGFSLFKKLSTHYNCIEVYPQAIVRALNVAKIHKSKADGLRTQLEAISKYTEWPTGENKIDKLKKIGFSSVDDKLDAYMSAWIASLPEENRHACGTPPNDVIWIPSSNISKNGQ